MKQLVLQHGYLGIFTISLIGALSIFFPVPYTIIIFGLGTTGVFDPVLIAIAAGLGSGVGEFSGYLLGFYGRKIISQEKRRKMEFMVKVFDRFGPFGIFLFALTPLPDDLLFIPLGMMHYNILKAFIPAVIGKTCMNFIVASGGMAAGSFLEWIGVENDLIAFLFGGFLGIILFIVIMFIMFKIDWEKVFIKYAKREEKGNH
jgi:membrane protein YqaA with SNARE-associated domain